MVVDDPLPWWADDPELMEIRRRTQEEFEHELDVRKSLRPAASDPVMANLLGGASWRELAQARDDLARARIRYEEAVRAARAAGFSWGEIGKVLGVPKQLLHRRFRNNTQSHDPDSRQHL